MPSRLALSAALVVLHAGCSSDGGPPDATDASQPDAAAEVSAEDVAPDAAADADTAPDTTGDAGPVAPDYPLDDVLRLNHVQVKGTHNSYHLQPDPTIPEWSYSHAPLAEQLTDQGVRMVELDVHIQSDDTTFRVFHLPEVDARTTCETFRGCLSEVKAWSDAHPGHHLLWILVEPKDDFDHDKIAGHYDALDAAILDVWPRERLLVPDDVRGDHATLRQALEADGWPTLGETRNRAMLVMLDSGSHRDGYLAFHPDLEGAVIFTRGGRGEPWSSVLEIGDPVGRFEEIRSAVEAGYLVRSTAGAGRERTPEENQANADTALSSGAHIISVDRAGPEGWDWWFEIPEGTPSRCNPVTAPPECTPEAVEALAP